MKTTILFPDGHTVFEEFYSVEECLKSFSISGLNVGTVLLESDYKKDIVVSKIHLTYNEILIYI